MHASTTSTKSDLPDFATSNQLSLDRWEAVAKATREANELTMGSLAGLVADRFPDSVEVHLDTTWDDEARCTCAPSISTGPTAPGSTSPTPTCAPPQRPG